MNLEERIHAFSQLGDFLKKTSDLEFAQKLNLSYKLGYNLDNSTIKKYKINSFPTTIFVSKSDNKFIIWDGYIGYDDLLKNTKKILAEEK